VPEYILILHFSTGSYAAIGPFPGHTEESACDTALAYSHDSIDIEGSDIDQVIVCKLQSPTN